MIDVTNLSCRYGNLTAVDQLSSLLGCGKTVVWPGRNGAGKATIMETLTGFSSRTAEDIRIAGETLLANRCGAQACLR